MHGYIKLFNEEMAPSFRFGATVGNFRNVSSDVLDLQTL